MKDTLQRILFYLRYEMTEDVRTRIELASIACVLLVCLGVSGYYLHKLHQEDKQAAEMEALFKAEIEDVLLDKRPESDKPPFGHYIYTPEPRFVYDDKAHMRFIMKKIRQARQNPSTSTD